MANVFRPGNRFDTLMSTVGDLIALNVVWAISSLPVITLGASTAALNATIYEIVHGYSPKVLRTFFKYFRDDFIRSLPLTLIHLIFWALAIFDLWYLTVINSDFAAVAYGILIVLFLIVASILSFSLPMFHRVQGSVKLRLLESARSAAAHPIIALVFVALDVLPLFLAIGISAFIVHIIVLWTLFLTAGSTWIKQRLLLSIGS